MQHPYQAGNSYTAALGLAPANNYSASKPLTAAVNAHNSTRPQNQHVHVGAVTPVYTQYQQVQVQVTLSNGQVGWMMASQPVQVQGPRTIYSTAPMQPVYHGLNYSGQY